MNLVEQDLTVWTDLPAYHWFRFLGNPRGIGEVFAKRDDNTYIDYNERAHRFWYCKTIRVIPITAQEEQNEALD